MELWFHSEVRARRHVVVPPARAEAGQSRDRFRRLSAPLPSFGGADNSSLQM